MAKATAQRERGERLQIMLNADELVLVDNFRFKTRMPSRASAVRELLKRGLAGEGFEMAAVGAKSSEYGLSGPAPRGRDYNPQGQTVLRCLPDRPPPWASRTLWESVASPLTGIPRNGAAARVFTRRSAGITPEPEITRRT